MIKFFKRCWAYITTGANQKFDENADPKIQLEQAINEAQDQHRRLREQAANVIAQQKQTEMRLNRALEELQKVNGNARQAVLMSAEAAGKGDAAKASEYDRAAESFATRLIQLESEVDDLKAMALQTTQASDQAKAAVAQNGQALQKKLAERQQLLTQLEQTKMQETMNKAMSSLSETVGEDVPTIDEVRAKIEARYAKAQGMAELQGQSVDNRMAEVEMAAQNTAGQARLSEIRAELGLAPKVADAATATAAPASDIIQPADAVPAADATQQPTPGV
jgi:phage shock protein A